MDDKDKPKTIFRVSKNKDNPYVMLDKRPLNQENLSWKAKGIWAYLMSKPDDWTVVIEDIINRGKDGQRAVRSGLQELQDEGYIWQAQERDEHGKIVQHFWLVFERPQKEPPSVGYAILTKRKSGGQPILTFSTSGKPKSGKRNTTNNDSTNKDFKEEDVKETYGLIIKLLQGNGWTQGTLGWMVDTEIEKWEDHREKLGDTHPDKDIHGVTAVLEAAKISVKNNASSFSYLEAVMNSWRLNGYKASNKKNGKKGSKIDHDEYMKDLERRRKRKVE